MILVKIHIIFIILFKNLKVDKFTKKTRKFKFIDLKFKDWLT
ncbi:hypothetical protein HMPREF0204_11880 [Chryseobacterium gleum ATCC 35910]|uniref:Uncharacterized protein n=1 Tax=Chryseobacterium gleum ATCC 35910 TaxID=525257 RepID=A0ABP2IRJ1_CHRGE|nr:hypothetical protein HMPREF0204_11880 [Chryseobacterium gleum ATCC 35910]